MKILLIEPDRVLGHTYQTTLEISGHEVVWRRRGQLALDSLDSFRPDVIVLELQLGLHNGIEFLHELRSHSDWLELPVIVHTLNPNAQDSSFAKAFSELHVSELLYKPDTPTAKLLRTVERFAPKVV